MCLIQLKGPGRLEDVCLKKTNCVNCQQNHPAYKRSFKAYKKEKEILEVKLKENTYFLEARKIVSTYMAKTAMLAACFKLSIRHSSRAGILTRSAMSSMEWMYLILHVEVSSASGLFQCKAIFFHYIYRLPKYFFLTHKLNIRRHGCEVWWMKQALGQHYTSPDAG